MKDSSNLYGFCWGFYSNSFGNLVWLLQIEWRAAGILGDLSETLPGFFIILWHFLAVLTARIINDWAVQDSWRRWWLFKRGERSECLRRPCLWRAGWCSRRRDGEWCRASTSGCPISSRASWRRTPSTRKTPLYSTPYRALCSSPGASAPWRCTPEIRLIFHACAGRIANIIIGSGEQKIEHKIKLAPFQTRVAGGLKRKVKLKRVEIRTRKMGGYWLTCRHWRMSWGTAESRSRSRVGLRCRLARRISMAVIRVAPFEEAPWPNGINRMSTRPVSWVSVLEPLHRYKITSTEMWPVELRPKTLPDRSRFDWYSPSIWFIAIQRWFAIRAAILGVQITFTISRLLRWWRWRASNSKGSLEFACDSQIALRGFFLDPNTNWGGNEINSGLFEILRDSFHLLMTLSLCSFNFF